jgi:hypothetical protein
VATEEPQVRLPSSSLDVVFSILKGYASVGQETDLHGLAKLLGVGTTTISGNNGFLSATGLITGGKKKQATALGNTLGRALEHDQTDEAQRRAREAVRQTKFLADLVTTVRLKGGMPFEDLVKHCLFVSGKRSTKASRAGAKAAVDFLLFSGFLREEEGTVSQVP